MPLGAQYISPGNVVETSAIVDKELFEDNIEDARWTVGRIRVTPWSGLRDASLVTSQETDGETREDFTLTAGAGLQAYLPTGKLIWAAQALPEYTWWQDDESKRRLNGRYGLGLFAYFNRMAIEASHRRADQQSFFSSEIQELTSSSTDTSKLNVEVDVARHLQLVAIAERLDFTNEEEENAVLGLLDRQEERVRAGLRYLSPRGWTIGLGFEDLSVEFTEEARDLSHSGTSELLDVGFIGSRFSFWLGAELRDFEADPGSDFGSYDETTGSLETLWEVSQKTTLLTYARRRQQFSVSAQNAFSVEERQGARFDFDFSKSVLGLFAEVGEDEFESVATGLRERIDDVTSYGLDYRLKLQERFNVVVQVIYADYDSNLDRFDRDVTRFSVNVQLADLAGKLRLGRAA
ncbi:MAG: hypothetical protein GY769_25650, partial [bacterium]|nr:hypothetical protein [bacterium]